MTTNNYGSFIAYSERYSKNGDISMNTTRCPGKKSYM